MGRYMQVSMLSQVTGKVTWVDVHTGLGPSGLDTLLFVDPDSKKKANAQQNDVASHFRGAPGGIQNLAEGDSAGDVAAGYELTAGTLMHFYPHTCFPRSSDVLVLGQEFGTLPGFLVARAVILENQAFNYAKARQPFFATFIRDAFYVRTPQWKRSVLERGLAVLAQAVARSSE